MRLAALALITACGGEKPPASPPRPTVPLPQAGAVPVPVPVPEPPPEPRKIGCWEKTFGTPPSPESTGPSLDAPIPDCESCETLRVGPNAAGLHAQVLQRLQKVVAALPPPEIDEPVLWINSGKRDGKPGKSMHNQGLAIDAVICGRDTKATATALRDVGFTCVIEYFDQAGNPCNFAHGDLRGTQWATGAYAKGGRKAGTCPKRAVSKGDDCQNQSKADWSYGKK